MPTEPTARPGDHFPAEFLHHAVWLYHRFSLSLRDTERGVVVSHEGILRWCPRFGTEFAARRHLADG